MKTKKLLTLSLIAIMAFTWSTSAVSAGSPNAGDHCPEDQMPDHVDNTVKSHSNNYIKFWKGIHSPPGCRGLLPR